MKTKTSMNRISRIYSHFLVSVENSVPRTIAKSNHTVSDRKQKIIITVLLKAKRNIGKALVLSQKYLLMFTV